MSGLSSEDLDQYDNADEPVATAAPTEQPDSGIDVRIPTPAPEDDDTTLDAQSEQGGCGRAEGAS